MANKIDLKKIETTRNSYIRIIKLTLIREGNHTENTRKLMRKVNDLNQTIQRYSTQNKHNFI